MEGGGGGLTEWMKDSIDRGIMLSLLFENKNELYEQFENFKMSIMKFVIKKRVLASGLDHLLKNSESPGTTLLHEFLLKSRPKGCRGQRN